MLNKLWNISLRIFLTSYNNHRESVIFKSSEGRSGKMKGLDISGPPSLPRHFVVKWGCRSDIYFGEDEESEDDDEDMSNPGVKGDGDRY